MSKGSVSATPTAMMAVEIMDPRGLIGSCELEAVTQFRLLLLGIALAGYGRVVVSGARRTLVAQQRLYGEGRTPMECEAAGVPVSMCRPDLPQVTWCAPADSKHVRGRGIDISWGIYKHVHWDAIATIAAACGLTWGGEWKVRDYGHFEI